MTDNWEILSGEGFRRSVETNLDRDPVHIALDKKVPNAALVASQVKYLRRAERKLPSYHSARCILPPLAFEQASSETAAARKTYSGGLCIDLTCGLGVDSLYLSRRFGKVIALERDPGLAVIARENFRRLGAHNIEVINSLAEEFLTGFEGRADLVYADPDRRSAGGKKLVRIEDCSPDIVALLPLVRRIATRLVVKLSPLFDVDEVFRILGRNTRVEVISLGGECKEILAEVAGDILSPAVCVVAIGAGEACYPFENWNAPAQPFEPERYRRLIVPDVALQKARLTRRYFSEHCGGVWIDSDNGYGFATGDLGESGPSLSDKALSGKVFEIGSIEPFDPKCLKRRLKAESIKNIDIMRRNFPLSAAEIARQIGIREGVVHKGGKGDSHKGNAQTIAFTKAGGKLWQITVKPE